jgi:hypothetical protein
MRMPKQTASDQSLISSESPTLQRAWKEWRDPTPTPTAELIASLCALIEREHAAAAAHRAAGAALGHSEDVIEQNCNRYDTRARQLGDLVEDLGGLPPSPDDVDDKSIPVSESEVDYIVADATALETAIDKNRNALRTAYATLLTGELPQAVADRMRDIATVR